MAIQGAYVGLSLAGSYGNVAFSCRHPASGW
jgi:hypothetical protein